MPSAGALSIFSGKFIFDIGAVAKWLAEKIMHKTRNLFRAKVAQKGFRVSVFALFFVQIAIAFLFCNSPFFTGGVLTVSGICLRWTLSVSPTKNKSTCITLQEGWDACAFCYIIFATLRAGHPCRRHRRKRSGSWWRAARPCGSSRRTTFHRSASTEFCPENCAAGWSRHWQER